MTSYQGARFRKHFFYSLGGFLVGFTVLTDCLRLLDPALVIYASTCIISLTCFIIFAKWWKTRGSATTIYKWLTLLLIVTTWNDLIQIFIRYGHTYDYELHEWLVSTTLWRYKSVPKLLAMTYLLGFSLWQRYGEPNPFPNKTVRRFQDEMEHGDNAIVCGKVEFAGYATEGPVYNLKLVLKENPDEGESD